MPTSPTSMACSTVSLYSSELLYSPQTPTQIAANAQMRPNAVESSCVAFVPVEKSQQHNGATARRSHMSCGGFEVEQMRCGSE